MFSGLPPKADSLPILEPLPPPALGERRHRFLARRRVAVRRRAVAANAFYWDNAIVASSHDGRGVRAHPL